MSARKTTRTSFAFSAADDVVLDDRVSALHKAGLDVRPITLLRAIIYLASDSDLIAQSVRLTAEIAQLGGGEPPTVSRPTVEVDQTQLRRLDQAVLQLARANIVVTRTFVVRALLHACPKGRQLVEFYGEFQRKHPLKPRGLSKLRLAQKAGGAA